MRDRSFLGSLMSDRRLPRDERHEVARRVAMLLVDIPTCYMLEDRVGNIRFMQWLILPTQNEKLRSVFCDWYPPLTVHQALMEAAYVFPRYRGSGVLPSAIKTLVGMAAAMGVKEIVTTIPSWNSNSLQSFARLGFKPQHLKIEWRNFGIVKQRIISWSDVLASRGLVEDGVLAAAMERKCGYDKTTR